MGCGVGGLRKAPNRKHRATLDLASSQGLYTSTRPLHSQTSRQAGHTSDQVCNLGYVLYMSPRIKLWYQIRIHGLFKSAYEASRQASIKWFGRSGLPCLSLTGWSEANKQIPGFCLKASGGSHPSRRVSAFALLSYFPRAPPNKGGRGRGAPGPRWPVACGLFQTGRRCDDG